MLMELKGLVEKITYTNDDTGFTVARIRAEGRRDLIVAVGSFLSLTVGEIIEMRGEWGRHPKFGEQFVIKDYKVSVPATVNGIEKYLGSGLVKGIGPVMAGRIVKQFGPSALDIIENHIDRLAQVEGIGPKRISLIKQAWDEQKAVREIMIFLQTHGVTSGYAAKIYKQYGDASISVLRANPYRLAMDIWGIGFISADRIAERLGFSKDSHLRLEAGIIYVLNQLAGDGHVFFPMDRLVEKCREILEVKPEAVRKTLEGPGLRERIVIEDYAAEDRELKEEKRLVYLTPFHIAETGVAARMKALIGTSKSVRDVSEDKALAWVQDKLGLTLASRQAEAVKSALRDKVMIITGGPGTGKTTIIRAMINIFQRIGVRVMLAAPTGRAAKRLSEATGHEARTIHRLLEYNTRRGGFQKTEDNPLDCELLVVDEASMIDIILMYHLLKAVPPAATFILVGDVNQLPSVGPGNVLKDIISSGTVRVVYLSEIFRQARQSSIIVNAHRINSGRLPVLEKAEGKLDDFYFIEQAEPEEAVKIILELASRRIPGRFGLNPFDDIQVLAPMHRGLVGAANLNAVLQEALNPGRPGIIRGGNEYRLGDKVMQIRNDYEKEVFNGDIGRISQVNRELAEVTIAFDGREIVFDSSDLDQVVLAYAISIHKSQGSEYPAVIIPILSQHYLLLQRNLIYTAVTRGRKLVVIVGSRRALAMGIRNDRTGQRFTCLKERLVKPGRPLD